MPSLTSKDGTKIVYDKYGSGAAVILVTGAFSYRKFPALVKLARKLSENFAVYVYDRRGRGDSGDTAPYAVHREIEDLQAMIAQAGGSACIWGLSSGASLALRAASAGSGILKLALHEPPFVVEPGDLKPPPDFARRVEELISLGHRGKGVRYFMTEGMGVPSLVVGMMRIMPGVWPRLTSLAHTLPYDAALVDGYMSGQPLPASEWHCVTMPALVMEGTESPAALRHAARALASCLPNAALVSKKGLGHTKKLDADLIAAELLAFFKEKNREDESL